MTPRRHTLLMIGACLTLGTLLAGCSATAVKPWDRDLLSEKKMRFTPSPMLNSVDDHIYFSKEGSTGGTDVSGGGCGCN
jgi:hypothetical protein